MKPLPFTLVVCAAAALAATTPATAQDASSCAAGPQACLSEPCSAGHDACLSQSCSAGLQACLSAAPAAQSAAGQSAQTSGAPQTQSTDPQPESVRRPFRGLFGAPSDSKMGKQSLDLTMSAYGAYDDDLLAGDTGTSTTPLGYQQRGIYEGATAGLAYNRPGDRLAVSLDGDAAVNHYQKQQDTTPMYRAGGSLSLRLARRTRASVGGDFVYAPQYRLGLFASPETLTGEADPFSTVAPDFDLFKEQAYRTSGEFALTQGIGRRSSFEAYYSTYRVNYAESEFDYANWTGGARFTTKVTQHLGYHIGYAYSTADYSNEALSNPRGIHNIDAGADYSRALSVSRRTTFSFSTGSAILAGQTQFTTNDRNIYYRLTGDASLRHEIGRTWTAVLGYRRGVDWRETFNQPFLSDAVTASVEGLISRRIRFSSSADYTLGSVGFTGPDNGYDSESAQGGLEYALSRHLALFSRYVYYRYHFQSGVVLDPRFLPALDRQGVRVGLSASFPIAR